MTRILLPLIAIVGAIVIFAGPTRSNLAATTPLTQERAELSAALDSAQKIQVVREALQERYNAFKPTDLNRLAKMLPSHVDNVRLVIDISNMATAYGMVLKNIQIQQTVGTAKNGTGVIKNDGPEHLDFRFGVSGSYEALKLFLADLGKSLRIVDITDLTFSAKDADVYDFTVGLRTYWLQDK